MNTSMTEVIVSELATFIITMLGVTFQLGLRFGKLTTELTSVKDRLTRIEAMFEYRLKSEKSGGNLHSRNCCYSFVIFLLSIRDVIPRYNGA